MKDIDEYKNQRNFIDNKELYQHFVEWKSQLKQNPNARMPESIGKAIMIIATGFSHYYKFRGYTDLWKEAMVGDAICNCVKYAKNFDTDRFKNPHAYLTSICFTQFINRIPKEQKEAALKWRMLIDISGEIEDEDFQQYLNQPFLDDVQEKLEKYEESLEIKKTKQHQAVIEYNKKVSVKKQPKPIKPNLLGI